MYNKCSIKGLIVTNENQNIEVQKKELIKFATDPLLIIEIGWQGPFSLTTIKNNRERFEGHYCLYQIYGTHPIMGKNTLIYIGKSETITTRMGQHEYWLVDESDETEIYVGLLGGADWQIDELQGTENRVSAAYQLDCAERLLVYSCQPPYNSSLVEDFSSPKEHLLVLNLGKSACLPHSVSSYWYFSNYWEAHKKVNETNTDKQTLWQPY